MGDADSKVRAHAAEELSKLGPDAKNALGALKQALHDPDRTVRLKAAQAILLISPDDSQIAFEEFEHEVDAARKSATKNAMERIRGSDELTVSRLQSQVDNTDLNGKIRVVEQLTARGLKSRSAVSALIKILNESPEVRSSAIDALAKWGPLAAPALPAMLALPSNQCLSVIYALPDIFGYDSKLDYSLSNKELDEEILRVTTSSAKVFTGDDGKCFEYLTNKIGPLPTALITLQQFYIESGCFSFKLHGKPSSYEDFKLKVEFLVGDLEIEAEYLQHCESVAIRQLLSSTSPTDK